MRVSSRWVGLAVILLAALPLVASDARSFRADLFAVNGSHAQMGIVKVAALGEGGEGGTRIAVVGRGLTPGGDYLSLYYENHECIVEPYDPDDVIGTYRADQNGVGKTMRDVGDNLDEINSVSIRNASDFSLVACADLHPGT